MAIDIRVFPVDTLNGTSYRYRVDGYLSYDLYATPGSAWHDARRQQAHYKGGQLVMPKDRIVRS